MRIGLISPSRKKVSTYYSNNSDLNKFFSNNAHVPGFFHPNLALLTLASLTSDSDQVTLIDERTDTLTFEEQFDLVGISMITSQAIRGYEIATKFRKLGVYTVIGGIHPSICPEEANAYCDTVFMGEAENTWPQFLIDFKHGSPKKVYRDSGIDIIKSPVPRYDLVDISKFHILPIQTTRGCPRDCSFCSVKTVFGPKYRIKSALQVVAELESMQQITRNKRVIFNDDNMFVDKKRTSEILEAIKSFKIKYFAQTDISIADDENMLNLLKESGCVTLFIGFESLVPQNLASIDKTGWKLKQSQTYSEKCKKIQSYGIQILGSFMVGLDYDTRESLMTLKDFVIENNIWAQFLYLTPFPGTRTRNELILEGRISNQDPNWDLYTCFDAIVRPLNIDIQELNKTVLEMYNAIYSEVVHRKRTRYMIDQIKTANKIFTDGNII